VGEELFQTDSLVYLLLECLHEEVH
jgi:hypothetical protein